APGEAEERLEVLERVARHARAQGPAEDRVEIDEDLAPQQIVHLRLARGVLGHEPLERARLRAAEVVDVQIGMPREPRVDEIDERLEGKALALPIVRPEGLVPGLGVLEREGAEQVLEPAGGLEEGVPLEIEDDVAGRPRRERREATAGLDVERVPLERARALPDQL